MIALALMLKEFRFEPTPGVRTGAPPQLTQADAPESAPEQAPVVPDAEPQADPDTGSSSAGSSGWDAVNGWFVRWQWLILTGALVALALVVLPLAGRWHRLRGTSGADSMAGRREWWRGAAARRRSPAQSP